MFSTTKPAKPGRGTRGSSGPSGRWLLRTVPAAVGATALAVSLALGTASAGAAASAAPGRPASKAMAAAPGSDWARVPAGLQAAIDKTLSAQAVNSPAGLSMAWGKAGTVWFATRTGPGRFGLRPLSVGRGHAEALSPGPLVFGASGTTEALGQGLSTWYRLKASGFEQGFSVARRPAGAGPSFSIVLGYSGGLHPSLTSSGGLSISGRQGPVMTYGGLRATDATGQVLPARLYLGAGRVQLVIDDAGAVYPLAVDPYVAPSTTPAATFAGSGGEYLGWSVALSADGRTALVGAPLGGSGDGAAYVYTEAGGTWSATPAATFTGNSGEALGTSVALSADGGTALVGATSAGSGDGAAYVYAESGGSWSSCVIRRKTDTGSSQSGQCSGAIRTRFRLKADSSSEPHPPPGGGGGCGRRGPTKEARGPLD